MSSRIELGALAAWVLMGTVACPEPAEPQLVVAPPPSVNAPIQPAPVAAPPAPRVETLSAVVFEFGGKAEVRRAGAEEWVALSVGDAVRVSDEVRTSADGHLEMRFGDARIQVHEGSELTLQFSEARAIRAEVHGRASGEIDGGQMTFEGKGSGVTIVSTGGQLSLDANDKRTWASSLSGGARVSSDGGTVEVRPGQVAIAEGGALSRPAPIPKRVSLSVKWPTQAETNQPTLALRGKTSAYAQLLVMGRKVEAAPDGAFETQVPLKKGTQSIWVLAIDPLGRRATDSRKITFDPNAPAITGKVEYR